MLLISRAPYVRDEIPLRGRARRSAQLLRTLVTTSLEMFCGAVGNNVCFEDLMFRIIEGPEFETSGNVKSQFFTIKGSL